jgi:hypothetical protein
MNGGILKAAGYGATAALAGFLLSTTSARAADLGGNCCADLEERVAELEATTARKGNRRVSLTISGQVNTAVMAWDQGTQDGVYVVDNGVSRSGFNFDGTAKINPNLTAGFQMVIGLAAGARSHQVNQIDDDAGGATATGDGLLGVELANWFLRHDRLGEIRVGRINSASSGTTTVDLGGAGVIANANSLLWMGGMYLTNGADAVTTSMKWGALMGGNTVGISGLSRQNAVSYTSPTLHGFSFQVAAGEQDAINEGMWDAALRYAGEFSGFRVAAAISYGENAGNTSDFQDAPPIAGGSSEKWQGSASVLHVATGLYLTGAFVEQSYGGTMAALPDTTYWYVQGGISRNWTGLGNTVLYGEYGRYEDGGVGVALNTVTPDIVTSSEVEFWGLGIVQHIDAAAMELYLSYRNYEAFATTDTGLFGAAPDGRLDDLSIVAAGARIRF